MLQHICGDVLDDMRRQQAHAGAGEAIAAFELECRLLARAVTLQAINACLANAAREAEAEAAMASARQAQLRDELSACQRENAALTSRVSQLSGEASGAKANLAAARAREARLKVDVQSCEATIAAGKQKEACGVAKQQQLAAQVTQLQQELQISIEVVATERAAHQVR